jgi:hypothetical protein
MIMLTTIQFQVELVAEDEFRLQDRQEPAQCLRRTAASAGMWGAGAPTKALQGGMRPWDPGGWQTQQQAIHKLHTKEVPKEMHHVNASISCICIG